MKFLITKVETIPTRFGEYKEYTLKSECGRFTKTSTRYKNYKVGDEVNTFHTHPVIRLQRRLSCIGVDIELKGNFPWIYMWKVNGTVVDEIVGANHGFCIGYSESKFLSNTKALFEKIRELK